MRNNEYLEDLNLSSQVGAKKPSTNKRLDEKSISHGLFKVGGVF